MVQRRRARRIREERRRIAEAKAEEERIARAVEAAAKREASRTKRRTKGEEEEERHAHFVDGADAFVGDEKYPERPGTPPLSEPPVPSPRKTPTRKAQVPVYSVAGRKVSLFDLLREKILASGEGDARAAARRLNSPRISPERSTRWRSPR